MNAFGYLLQQGLGNLLVGRIFRKIDRYEELLRLSVNITNIHTTFMRKENPVPLDSRMLASFLRTHEWSGATAAMI